MTMYDTSIPPGSEPAPIPRASFEASRGARLAAVQALFQIRSTQQATLTVIQEFIDHRFQDGEYPYIPDTSLFKKLVL
jgi:transcription termination factor NusB